MKLFRIVLLLSLFHNLHGQAVKTADYTLDVAFFPERSSLAGEAQISLDFAKPVVPLDTLVFYLHGELRVDSILTDSGEMDFFQQPEFYYYDYALIATKVTLPSFDFQNTQNLSVWYSGYFHPSSARSPSDYMRIDRDGVFLRAYGYSPWFPIFLAPQQEPYPVSFSKVTLETPADMDGIFVGDFIGKHTRGDRNYFEWKTGQIELWDAQCTVSDFVINKSNNTFIYSANNPTSIDSGVRILYYAVRLDSLYQAFYKTEPVRRQLHVIQMPEFGDIASGNIVGISKKNWDDFDITSFSGRTLAHELVHPYVQMPVKMDDPVYALVIEGFPSYFFLPALGEIIGEDYYSQFILETEKKYLTRKQTQKDRRGENLPVEKSIFEISADEIGYYKDRFVLNDRVVLFLNYLLQKSGQEQFFNWTKKLFSLDHLDKESFEKLTVALLAIDKNDLHLWLATTEFPERFKINHD